MIIGEQSMVTSQGDAEFDGVVRITTKMYTDAAMELSIQLHSISLVLKILYYYETCM